MGRRRLYQTDEERRQANRAKSQRHYEKAKNVINTRRREKYHKETAKKSPTQSISSTPVRPSQQGTVLTAVDWLKRARRIEARFNEIVANDSVAYVQTLCVNFLLDKDKTSLHESSISLSKLRKTIYTCHAEILQACGVGDELSKVEAIEKEIQTAISWVEEVFCYAIVDWTEVERLFRARNFMYQTVDSGMA